MYDEQPQSSELEEVEIEAIGIEVSSQPIELYKIFKIANLVNGGGEAKHIIGEGYVAVNGEIETRKRRKMYDGDLVEFNQEYYVVLCDLPVGELPEVGLEAEENAAPWTDPDTIEAESLHCEADESQQRVDVDSSTAEPEQEKQPASGRKSIQFF
jgi:ribosome-associated protein